MPLQTFPALQSRPVERTDLPSIVDLLESCEVVDQLEANRSLVELQRSFDEPPPDMMRGWQLWETHDPTALPLRDRTLAGYGQYAIRNRAEAREAYLSVKLHPDYRGGSLEAEIVAWCEQEIQRLAADPNTPIEVRAGARSNKPYYTALYENSGYRATRWFDQMQRSLIDPSPEPCFPEGFTIRACRSEADVEPWVEMYNQTFIDHWNFRPLSVENRLHRIQSPSYQPELDWVAIAPDGRFAAFCGCGISAEENARTGRQEGWIHVLGTRRGFRRQGLARAMLLLGMQQLKAAGMGIAWLGVDTENPNQAKSLYESVGFERQHTAISYSKTLDGNEK